ncbi:MAG: response regulator [Myxococcales bacterium]|nr:response regulator [Myxococcales bacterium]
MPKTILAVDDSATMRKVLEITFAGEDFRVLSAEGVQSAMSRAGEGASAAVIDASLEGDQGYTLARDLRARDPRLAIVLLASRYNPYDANRGRDAGVDDYADKPFDTQALIDKVKKAIVARESSKAVAAPAPVAAPAQAPAAAAPFAAAARPSPSAGGPSPVQRPGFPTQRTHTLSFEGTPPVPPVAAGPSIARTAPSAPIVQPAAARPGAAPTAPAPNTPGPTEHTVRTAVPPRPPAEAATSANGQFAGRLGELGLTPAQVDAVLALSREVVERVVWEVVPQLAEVIIKEEITRLTRDV